MEDFSLVSDSFSLQNPWVPIELPWKPIRMKLPLDNTCNIKEEPFICWHTCYELRILSFNGLFPNVVPYVVCNTWWEKPTVFNFSCFINWFLSINLEVDSFLDSPAVNGDILNPFVDFICRFAGQIAFLFSFLITFLNNKLETSLLHLTYITF